MRLLIAIAVVCLFGCTDPTVARPLGARLEQQSLPKLSGVWQTPEGKQIHAKSVGERLFIGFLDFDSEQQKFIALTSECILTFDGNHNFAFFKHFEEDEGYYFYEVTKLSDEVFSLRKPDADVFRRGVNDGKISGTIISHQNYGKKYQRAHIDVNEDKFFAFLRAETMNMCFPKSSEVTYRKQK